jgi:hypothetical protein
MRYPTLALALALAACGNPTEPSPPEIPGVYNVVSILGQPMPYQGFVFADTFWIERNQSWRHTQYQRFYRGEVLVRDTIRANGHWTIDGDSIRLQFPNGDGTYSNWISGPNNHSDTLVLWFPGTGPFILEKVASVP